MSTDRVPIAYHPGEEILEEIEARGRSQTQFAQILDLDKSEINNIIRGRRNITPRIAARIGAAFGTGGEVWMRLQQMYDRYQLSLDKEESKKLHAIPKRVKQLAMA